jgi:site-specific DNA-cytosine methylase
VQPDVDEKPWVQWAADGLQTDIVVAGVACQPFSTAGRMMEERDWRAFQSLLVLEAALMLGAKLVLLENVPGLTNNDFRHKVYSVIVLKFRLAGFSQHRWVSVQHHQLGGRTRRSRVFLAFARAGEVVDWDRWVPCRREPAGSWPAEVPLSDGHQQGWGPVAQGSVLLGGECVTVGCAVAVAGKPGSWRVMHHEGDVLQLMNANRREPSRDWCLLSDVVGLDRNLCSVPVRNASEVQGTLTASGEPPRYGADLLVNQSGVAVTAGIAARWRMHQADPDDLQFLLSLGCSLQQLRAVVGGMVPADMAAAVLQPLLESWTAGVPAAKRTRAECESGSCLTPLPVSGTAGEAEQAMHSELPTDEMPVVLPSLALPGSTSSHSRICIVPVDVTSRKVQVSSMDSLIGISVDVKKAVTGKVVAAVQKLLPQSDLVVAGKGYFDSGDVWVVLALGFVSCTSLQEVSLQSLEDTALHSVAALAVARALSFVGHANWDELRPLLGADRTVAGGAEQPRTMPQHFPAASTQGSETLARQQLEAAALCQQQVAEKLLGAAAEAELVIAGEQLSEYLQGWALQIPDPTSLYHLLPNEAFGAKFDNHQLANQRFAVTAAIPTTQELPAVLAQEPLPDGFKPSSIEDLFVGDGAARYHQSLSEQKEFLTSIMSTTEDVRQLAARRPAAVAIGQSQIHPAAWGKIFDNRGPELKLLDFTAPVDCRLDSAYFAAMLPQHKDKQMFQFIKHGVRSQAQLLPQCLVQSHLLSLANAVPKVHEEIVRLQDQGMVGRYMESPFFPVRTNSMGAVPKGASFRRISDMGQPRKPTVDESGVPVDVYNESAIRDSLGNMRLPKERKALAPDALNDMAILRYIGDQVDLALLMFSDDLKDFFRQLAVHPSELWQMPFLWAAPGSTEAEFVAEERMGFGLAHASNVAQRLANAVTQMFIKEFARVDAPFLEEDCSRHPVLRAWIEHRKTLGGDSEARLFSGFFYTDDWLCFVLGHDRFVRAVCVWFEVTRRFGLACAVPRKRVGGVCLVWCGLAYFSLVGGAAITADKKAAAQHKLAEAAGGKLQVGQYRSLVGLLEWVRFALSIAASKMKVLYEPLRLTAELGEGPATWVRATAMRKFQWSKWSSLLATANFASAALVTGTVSPVPAPRSSVFVWHADAAIKGTAFPALCGFFAGLYWVFPLTSRHLQHLHITALELLAQMGNFLIFGRLFDSVSSRALASLTVLLQCDSLVSTKVLTAMPAAHPLSLTESNAKSSIMRHIHEVMLRDDLVQWLSPAVVVGHIWGEGNVMSDAGSRGKIDLLKHLCTLCGLKHKRVTIPPKFTHIVERAVRAACNDKQQQAPVSGT